MLGKGRGRLRSSGGPTRRRVGAPQRDRAHAKAGAEGDLKREWQRRRMQQDRGKRLCRTCARARGTQRGGRVGLPKRLRRANGNDGIPVGGECQEPRLRGGGRRLPAGMARGCH